MHIAAALCIPNSMVAPLLALEVALLRRREFLINSLAVTPVLTVPLIAVPTTASAADATELQDPRWTSLGLKGTSIHLLSVESAAQADTIGPTGLYPDPLLRRTASPVTDFGPAVEKVVELLVTGMQSNATTALHYGIDARIILLNGAASPNPTPLAFINPVILSRSGEESMVPWREYCRVLPPDLGMVDLWRDEVVEVAAQDVRGVPIRKALRGEAARAFQHELDHLDGILIIDHARLDELPSAIAKLEAPYHAARQRRAFERNTYQGNAPLYW